MLALPFAYAMGQLTARAYDTELYRMPMIFEPPMIAVTAAVSALFLIIAQWVVGRQIRTG